MAAARTRRRGNAHTHWLATTRPDGAPHVMPVGAVWLDGAFYFTAGPATRKAKNLAHNPRCAIALRHRVSIWWSKARRSR